MTGVLRVAKAGYLSRLNNLEVHSLLDEASPFAYDFGATHEEVIEALKYEGLEDKLNQVESYYNGYSTGTDVKGKAIQSLVSIELFEKKSIGTFLGGDW